MSSKCQTPFYRKPPDHLTPLPCGKCPACVRRRVSGWSFRLMQEDKRSDLSLFVTLTYDTLTVPITRNGFMSLKKEDIQLFIKRLRKYADRNSKPIRYYCAGEYGSKYMRPHYHLIMFNAKHEHVIAAWKREGKEIGAVHFGTVTEASVGYSLKYISKAKTIPLHSNDDRLPEFALMSKHLGDNYINPKQSHIIAVTWKIGMHYR